MGKYEEMMRGISYCEDLSYFYLVLIAVSVVVVIRAIREYLFHRE